MEIEETRNSSEMVEFSSLGRRAPLYSEKQMFGKRDDGSHFKNIDFEVMAKASSQGIQKVSWEEGPGAMWKSHEWRFINHQYLCQ